MEDTLRPQLQAVFTARGLTKTYRMGEVEVHALRGVDLDIYASEFVVLLGPSGSGKSTLLNILGGLDVPTNGTVRYLDHNLTALDDGALTRYRREHDDRETGRTTRVSRSSRGVEADGGSLFPALSADGRFVAFQSYAANLVHGDDNGVGDVFVHDRATGRTARVSVSAAGEEGNGESGNPSDSAEGRFVAFWSLATNFAPAGGLPSNVFVHDRLTGDLRLASPVHDGGAPAGDCGEPRLSADGRQVVFSSSSPYLLPEDTNSRLDVFVRGPLRSLRHADDFAQGALRWVLGPGRWTVEGRGRALSSSAARAANVAVHERPAGDAPFSAGAILARVRMVKPLRGEANAEVLFHVQNSGAFRFVRLTPGRVVLGQVGGFANTEPGIYGRARVPSLTAGRWHDVTVEVGPQAQVHVSVGGAHLRLGQFTQSEGRVGFRGRRAVSQFDDFEIVEAAPD